MKIMKLKKKVLSIAASFILILSVLSGTAFSASGYFSTDNKKYGDVFYADMGNYIEITGFWCSDNTDIKIPDYINGKPVTSIRSDSGDKELTGVEIPETVTNIEESAFRSCRELKQVTIPDSVTNLGRYAFYECESLENAVLSNNLKAIRECTFLLCSSLKEITIPDSVEIIDISAFYGCHALSRASLGNSVKAIGNQAFSCCYSLTEITFPESVTEINYAAFSNCSSLETINMSGNISKFGKSVFEDTKWYDNQPDGPVYLKNIFYKYKGTMPENINFIIKNKTTIIGGSAFENMTGLTTVSLPDSIVYIGDAAFSYSGLTNIVIPDGVKAIGISAFSGCKKLTDAVISDSVEKIGDNAFRTCSILESVYIGKNVEEIGLYAFYECRILPEIEIPAKVSSIGQYAFVGCYSLESITVDKNNLYYLSIDGVLYNKTMTQLILYPSYKKNDEFVMPATVVKIMDFALYYNSHLKRVKMPESVKEIGASAFKGCYFLKEISFPNSIISVGPEAFVMVQWYNNLPDGIVYIGKTVYCYKGEAPDNSQVTIKNGIVSITESAFKECSGIQSVILPESIKHIGKEAFKGCTSLTEIRIPESLESIDKSTFENCTSLTNVTFSEGLKSVGYNSFANTNIKEIIIPYSLTNIDQYAFNECPYLEKVKVLNKDTNFPTINISDSVLIYVRYDSLFAKIHHSYNVAVFGDVNNNYKLDLYDAIETAKYMMGICELSEDQLEIADYNVDGIIDLYDIIPVASALL